MNTMNLPWYICSNRRISPFYRLDILRDKSIYLEILCGHLVLLTESGRRIIWALLVHFYSRKIYFQWKFIIRYFAIWWRDIRSWWEDRVKHLEVFHRYQGKLPEGHKHGLSVGQRSEGGIYKRKILRKKERKKTRFRPWKKK